MHVILASWALASNAVPSRNGPLQRGRDIAAIIYIGMQLGLSGGVLLLLNRSICIDFRLLLAVSHRWQCNLRLAPIGPF